MPLLASFNYQDPPGEIMLAGLIAALVVLLLSGFTRSMLAGFFGGALAFASIAWLVYGQGRGDMRSFVQVTSAGFYGVGGAVLGLLAGLVGNLVARRRARKAS